MHLIGEDEFSVHNAHFLPSLICFHFWVEHHFENPFGTTFLLNQSI